VWAVGAPAPTALLVGDLASDGWLLATCLAKTSRFIRTVVGSAEVATAPLRLFGFNRSLTI
jgi:hypothetical protein